jgi:ribosomal protein L35AE/L33A
VERGLAGDERQICVVPEKRLAVQGSVNCEGKDFEDLVVQVLSAGHALRFRARGRSMHPLVRDGDVLDVLPVEHAAVGVGDIILYRSPCSGIVVHRVLGTHDTGQGAVLVVKGDAARTPDPEVVESQVFGKIVGIERGGRRIAPDRQLWRYLAVLSPHYRRVRGLAYLLVQRVWKGLSGCSFCRR